MGKDRLPIQSLDSSQRPRAVPSKIRHGGEVREGGYIGYTMKFPFFFFLLLFRFSFFCGHRSGRVHARPAGQRSDLCCRCGTVWYVKMEKDRDKTLKEENAVAMRLDFFFPAAGWKRAETSGPCAHWYSRSRRSTTMVGKDQDRWVSGPPYTTWPLSGCMLPSSPSFSLETWRRSTSSSSLTKPYSLALASISSWVKKGSCLAALM